MSFVIHPPTDQDDNHMPGDDLDNLLRSYFQAEMPSTWPACPYPVETPRLLFLPPAEEPATPSRIGLLSSRFALAASVALLFGGSIFLADSFKETPTANGTLDSAHREKYPIRESLRHTPNGTGIAVEVQDPDLIDWPMK